MERSDFKSIDLKSMSSDELYLLHLEMVDVLTAKLAAKRNELEERLQQLKPASDDREGAQSQSRRPYPLVIPKFRNPDRPSETWSGRGRRPRWLCAQLRSGKRIDDFRI